MTMIFVNLAVKDLKRSMDFFTKVGYTFNPQFTDENAACMIISDTIFTMLLVEPFFKTFTDREITDTSTHLEVMNAFSCESREEVDAIVARAVAAGATTPRPPQDMGFMYGHSFLDLDGHLWDYFYMDPSHVA